MSLKKCYSARLRRTLACILCSLLLSACQQTVTVTPIPIKALTSEPTATTAVEATNTPSPTATAEVATATPASTSETLVTASRPLLYASGGDLWCSDMSGENRLQLTHDDALNLVAPPPSSGVDVALSWGCAPTVSPDGRWLTYSLQSSWMRTLMVMSLEDGSLQEVDNTCYGIWSPDSTRLAYAANLDSPANEGLEPVLYVYNVLTQERITYYPPDDENTWEFASAILWAPDGNSLAFRGTSEIIYKDGEYTGEGLCNVIKLDLLTGESTVVGTVWTAIASSQTFCLDSEGNFTTDRELGVVCSRTYTSYTSPNGLWTYNISTEASNSTVSMLDAEGDLIWKRALDFSISPDRIHWSLDGTYLLIDDYNMTTPIWRLAADGSGELEQIIEEGYLLQVVSPWDTVAPTDETENTLAPPTAAPASASQALITSGLPVLYVDGGDLWCTDISGTKTLQLTQEDALNLVAPPPAGSSVSGILSSDCGPNVSPDGRWIAYYPYSEWMPTLMVLSLEDGSVQEVDNTCYGLWSPDSTRLAYAPSLDAPWNEELEPVVYVYNVLTQERTAYYPPDDENTWTYAYRILWTPDGQSLAFRGTTGPEQIDTESGIEYYMCNVIKLDLQMGASTVVGAVRTSIASEQAFCLDSEGNFTTDIDSGVVCSKHYTPQEATTSPDGRYVLVDDTDMTTPIWRQAADGSGEREVVVDEGYLLQVVSAWAE